MTEQTKSRVFHHYETRGGRVVPLARVTAAGRVYRLRWMRCQECGTKFLAVRSDAQFDSDKCRAKSSRRRRKLRAALTAARDDNMGLFQMPLPC